MIRCVIISEKKIEKVIVRLNCMKYWFGMFGMNDIGMKMVMIVKVVVIIVRLILFVVLMVV